MFLKNWYEGSSFSTTSRNMVATEEDGVLWYCGIDTGTRDYTKSIAGEGISATIGLPSYCEMFSSQFGLGVYSLVPKWLMTKWYAVSNAYLIVTSGGHVNSLSSIQATGVRPSMYLKSNVRIGDTNGDGNVGNGTLNYPYELVLGQ